ncbi:MAG TPA: ABC transporter permease [Rhodospirillaceae bacterium]|nr:NAD synthetase [Rhodospirillaceae bacterium]MAX60900.1 NAD synthetase [Rhodospirillaceae bacterium]MAX65222.1 NAD synthetase [Rhodospirillaceae bacterium]MBB55637.1 NAD synthetase [Rhodospirillaceae bacterium]HBM13836.1 ABC transporter permease [Rhodospirillaceae bacterium]|tara:strand:- start:23791 stop:24693 length:903 start_codon:yes stop_codon:yes gene_type:complete
MTHPTPLRRGQRIRGNFLRNRLAVLSLFILILLVLTALTGPHLLALLHLDGFETDLFNLKGPPGPGHPLGTDELGRDVLARLILGSQASLSVGLITALTAAILGSIIGICAGYFGGWLDSLLMRLTDGVIALPLLPLLIVLSALDFDKIGLGAFADGSGLMRLVMIISLVAWPTVARLVRAETLSLKQREFVVAARAQGATPFFIMRRHIFPNVQASIVIATTLSIGNIILLESVLSFLGLGIRPPTPSWGTMLTNAQDYIWDSPNLALWPGLAIFITVIAFNFLGDGLQDALDPKQHQQ